MFNANNTKLKVVNGKHGSFYFMWFYHNIAVGHMTVGRHKQDNSIMVIAGYVKEKKISKIGYHFIKMSINYLIKKEYKVLSIKRHRNQLSDRVWEKLKSEYLVNECEYSPYGGEVFESDLLVSKKQ